MTDKDFDEGLKAVMGARFTDKTEEPAEKPLGMPVAKKKSNPAKSVSGKDVSVFDQWEPEKPAPDMMQKLKNIVKDVFVYAVISMLLFWWKQTGRLEETTAWYALIVCVGMVFFSVGKHCRGGGK